MALLFLRLVAFITIAVRWIYVPFCLPKKVPKKGPAIDYGPMAEAALLNSSATVTSAFDRYS
jgi:hypothetical protein